MKVSTNEMKYQARYNMRMCSCCIEDKDYEMARYYYGKATAYEEMLQDLGVNMVEDDIEYENWCELYENEVVNR